MSQAELTALIELVGFLLMLFVIIRWVYPLVNRIVEERQKAIAAQLAAADKARVEADEQLEQAQASVQAAEAQARQIIERANHAAERIRQEGEVKANEEGKRIVEAAGRDIDVERQRAVHSIRQQMADTVTIAAARIVRQSLDTKRHKELIEVAIRQVEKVPGGAG